MERFKSKEESSGKEPDANLAEFKQPEYPDVQNISMMASQADMSMSIKKPKFKNKMACIKSRQEKKLRAKRGEHIKLQWEITNASRSNSWPIQPCITNFSDDLLFDPEDVSLNAPLRTPKILPLLLQPLQTYAYELFFTVPPNFEQSILTLNLYLTNPARQNEKFGDLMLVVLEVAPLDIPEESPMSHVLEKSEYMEDEDSKFEESPKAEVDPLAVTGQDIG